jgi:hypothetical protein
MPAAPAPSGAPVFSVWQSDVIFYGRNLLDYLHQELGPTDADFYRRRPSDEGACRPWSLLAVGYEPGEITDVG